MGNFQYKSGASWVDVPDAAHPDDERGGIQVVFPPATDLDGQGNPAGAVGLPELVIESGFMTGTGMNFWTAFFSDAVVETATLTGITGYNIRTGTWVKYTGTLWRPQAKCKPAGTAALTGYNDVQIHIKNITVTT
jgi:hypothetical protein